MGTVERKERDRREMRRLILGAAMKLFLEEGFEQVSMRRIAKKIEYSPAMVYLYFKNKDEILYALHQEGFDKLIAQQRALFSVKDPMERLRKSGEEYIKFALDNCELYDLMFIMRGPVKKIQEDQAWDCGLESYDFLRQNVRECIEGGYIAHKDVEAVSFALWSLVHGMASLLIRERLIMIPEQHRQAIIQSSLNCIMADLIYKE